MSSFTGVQDGGVSESRQKTGQVPGTYLGPSLISRPFLYHLTSAFSLVSLHVNSAFSNSVMVWSLSWTEKSVGASLMTSSAVDLLSPATAVYPPSSDSVQSLIVSVCLSLSTR